MKIIREAVINESKEDLSLLVSPESYQESLQMYNDISLCESFGWTPQDILSMPHNYYQSALSITLIKNAKEKKQADKQKNETEKQKALSRLKSKHGQR